MTDPAQEAEATRFPPKPYQTDDERCADATKRLRAKNARLAALEAFAAKVNRILAHDERGWADIRRALRALGEN